MHALYGENLDKTFSTWYRFGTLDVVYFDHAQGVFVVGGTEMNQAFKVSTCLRLLLHLHVQGTCTVCADFAEKNSEN